MKLGLLTDIHEHVEFLSLALARFDLEHVDQVVVVGDVFQMGERIQESCQLLAAAKAVGVWGNHDFGLCFEPTEQVRTTYPATVLDFMGSLKPRLVVGGCHFCHVEPWLDPEQLSDLWYFEGPPDEHGKLARIFSAVPDEVLFAGHFHKWLLATPDGIVDWHGDGPIALQGGRYFVVLAALCDGHFATYDTETSLLVPLRCLSAPSTEA